MNYKDFCAFLYLVNVSFTERVRIVKGLRDLTVTAGESARFVCELSHENVLDGVWWLGSNVLQENEMNQMSICGKEHQLVLTMTTPEESGVVSFVVGNEKTSAHLRVNSKPKGECKDPHCKQFHLILLLNSRQTVLI